MDYVKLKQPLGLVDELGVLQAGLQLCVEIPADHSHDTLAGVRNIIVQSEIVRRSQITGFNNLLSLGFILGLPLESNMVDKQLELPCSPSVWERLCEEAQGEDEPLSSPQIKNAIHIFDSLVQQTNEAATTPVSNLSSSDFIYSNVPTMLSLLTHRLRLIGEASKIPSLANSVAFEQERLM